MTLTEYARGMYFSALFELDASLIKKIPTVFVVCDNNICKLISINDVFLFF